MLETLDNVCSFKQDLSKWDASRVADINYMFSGANFFNRDVFKWDGPTSATWDIRIHVHGDGDTIGQPGLVQVG